VLLQLQDNCVRFTTLGAGNPVGCYNRVIKSCSSYTKKATTLDNSRMGTAQIQVGLALRLWY